MRSKVRAEIHMSWVEVLEMLTQSGVYIPVDKDEVGLIAFVDPIDGNKCVLVPGPQSLKIEIESI